MVTLTFFADFFPAETQGPSCLAECGHCGTVIDMRDRNAADHHAPITSRDTGEAYCDLRCLGFDENHRQLEAAHERNFIY